jgi:hypothetical protein
MVEAVLLIGSGTAADKPTGGEKAVCDGTVKLTVVVQIFQEKTTKGQHLRPRSCREHFIPEFGRPVIFDAKPSEIELTFSDPMHEFDASDGDRGVSEPL